MDLDNITPMNDDIDLSKADRGDLVDPPVDDAQDPPADTKQETTPPVDDKQEDKAEDKDDERARNEDGTFKKKDEDVRIPKQRFDEAVRKERAKAEAAEQRIRALEEQLQTRKDAEDMEAAKGRLREMIKQRNNLLADGELDKASELDEKIFDFQQLMAERQAEVKAASAKESAKEEMRYDTVVAKLEVDYPQINPDSELYDTDVVAEIKEIMDGLVATKKATPSAALQKAVRYVLGNPAAPKGDEKAKDVGMRRKEEAVKRNMDAAKKQPASTTGVGMDSDKAGGALTAEAVMKMSQDDFAKLPETVLSKMRGDYLE